MNEEILDDARRLASHIVYDIKNASTRIEHIRLTQLAMEAERLADKIEKMIHSKDADPA